MVAWGMRQGTMEGAEGVAGEGAAGAEVEAALGAAGGGAKMSQLCLPTPPHPPADITGEFTDSGTVMGDAAEEAVGPLSEGTV